MIKTGSPCPFCGEKLLSVNSDDPIFTVKCWFCGEYMISQADEKDISHGIIREDGLVISAYIREKHEQRKLDVYVRREPDNGPILLTNDSFEYILAQAPKTPVDKADRVLLNMAHKSRYFGDQVHLAEQPFHAAIRQYNLGYCENKDEFGYILNYLKEVDLIREVNNKYFFLTTKGWQRVQLLQQTNVMSDQAFVAMSFEDRHLPIYMEAIEPAILGAKYLPYRIDQKEHIDKIDDKIFVEIKRSKFIVAEFTGQKHGVYFEAGYALGLGIPVIWVCKKANAEKLHFDIRQFNSIVWKDKRDLRERLKIRIIAVIGEGNRQELQ